MMIVGSLMLEQREQWRLEEVVLSRGYMLFLLTPTRTVMAAACPMRSSLRLGWRIYVQPPPTPLSRETKNPEFRQRQTEMWWHWSVCINKTHFGWLNPSFLDDKKEIYLTSLKYLARPYIAWKTEVKMFLKIIYKHLLWKTERKVVPNRLNIWIFFSQVGCKYRSYLQMALKAGNLGKQAVMFSRTMHCVFGVWAEEPQEQNMKPWEEKTP